MIPTPNVRFALNPDAPPMAKDIFRACIQGLENRTRLRGMTGMSQLPEPGITLVLKGLKPASQTHRYLFGKNSPKGEIVADQEGGQLVSFKIMEVLAWMTANKICTAETLEQS